MARILIVDDSPSQLMGIKRIVEKLGHEALTAEDGAAGVNAAKRELPDLILMDVVMPNLNGFQATRAINPMHRATHLADVCRTVLFLAETESVNGEIVTVDRGQTLMNLPRDVAFLDEAVRDRFE